ncbi:unnamed protein product [Rotaria sp. Silwood1]|nr:unnamed protein product [Rotaria sp. Silwood1]
MLNADYLPEFRIHTGARKAEPYVEFDNKFKFKIGPNVQYLNICLWCNPPLNCDIPHARKKFILLGYDIDVPPGLYETQKYNTINVPVESARHSVFKSKTTRKLFLPKIGPAPGDYEPKTNVTNVHSPTITSSFRSRTDRFHRKLAKVPGPGTYDKLTIFPTPKQINTLSMRGVFFNANYAHKAATAI